MAEPHVVSGLVFKRSELVEKLAAMDVSETPENIANKISRESSLRFFCCNA